MSVKSKQVVLYSLSFANGRKDIAQGLRAKKIFRQG